MTAVQDIVGTMQRALVVVVEIETTTYMYGTIIYFIDFVERTEFS